MKKLSSFFIAVLALALLSGCTRNSYPVPGPDPYPPQYPAPAPGGPVIIIDGDGRVMRDVSRLPPGQQKKIYGHKSAKAFAPGQRKKMQQRYGYVPPLVIYVPDAWATKSNGNLFYMYNKNIRYWKNSDGYYHADDTYFYDRNDNDDDSYKHKGKDKQKYKKNKKHG